MKESIRHIAKALKEARLKKGLSQRLLSEKTKIPQNHISKIENGEVDLQTSTLIELSRTLELELMLVPISLIPMVTNLQKSQETDRYEQTPKYSLDDEDDNYG